MCQVGEEYAGELEKKTVLGVCKTCVKCKQNQAVLIIRAGDAFCRSCFKDYFIHKFRAMLGKNRLIFPGEKVLLAVSGGPASSSMLAQVQEGLSQDAPKKLRFKPGIIYVDEGGACCRSDEVRQEAVAQLEEIFRQTGFPYYIVSLEQVFSLPGSVLNSGFSASESSGLSYKEAVDQYILQNQYQDQDQAKQEVTSSQSLNLPEHQEALQKLFSSIKTLTAKEDMLQTLRHHLILHTARVNGYTKVMCGESRTRLAIKLLTNVSLGRGAALSVDTGFSDGRYGDVVLVRPMRDYSSKEIIYYNHLFNIQSVYIPSLSTRASDKASVQRLTESFILKLQADFPSTVNTIYRTSEKLNTASPPAQSSALEPAAKCLLCLCALDINTDEASAFGATLLSERLSVTRTQTEPGSAGTSCAEGTSCGEGTSCRQETSCGSQTCCSKSRAPASPDLKSLLCYSCRLIIKDMTSLDFLPNYITSEADKRHRRAQMKEEISEFLLDEDDDDDETAA